MAGSHLPRCSGSTSLVYVRIRCRSTAFLWQRCLIHLSGRRSSSVAFSVWECIFSVHAKQDSHSIQQKAGVPHSLTIVQELWEEETVVSHPLKCILKPEIRMIFLLEFSAAIQLFLCMLVLIQTREKGWSTACPAFAASCFVYLAEERCLVFDIPVLLLIIFK